MNRNHRQMAQSVIELGGQKKQKALIVWRKNIFLICSSMFAEIKGSWREQYCISVKLLIFYIELVYNYFTGSTNLF